jgi:hypothetical protein
MSKLFNKQNFNVAKEFVSTIKNKLNKKNSTISSVKTNVPKTKLDKANSNLDIAIHKNKASKAKLGQTIFEIENKMPITFKGKKGKSESNTESYKRITGENNKVIKGMLDKAAEKK